MNADRFPTFRSYFYPETIGEDGTGTLQNLLDERDHDTLVIRETERANRRMRQLGNGQAEIRGRFDGEHLRALHRHLFQDVYEWAGEYRTVNMIKGEDRRSFGNARTGELQHYLEDMHRIVATTDWAGLDQREFAAQTARVFAYLNQAHPFREGNGRTAKLYLVYLAEQSHFALDFRNVLPGQWNTASQLSRPVGKDDYEPDPSPLIPVFEYLTVPSDEEPRRDLGGAAERLRAATRPDRSTRPPSTIADHPLRPTMPRGSHNLDPYRDR